MVNCTQCQKSFHISKKYRGKSPKCRACNGSKSSVGSKKVVDEFIPNLPTSSNFKIVPVVDYKFAFEQLVILEAPKELNEKRQKLLKQMLSCYNPLGEFKDFMYTYAEDGIEKMLQFAVTLGFSEYISDESDLFFKRFDIFQSIPFWLKSKSPKDAKVISWYKFIDYFGLISSNKTEKKWFINAIKTSQDPKAIIKRVSSVEEIFIDKDVLKLWEEQDENYRVVKVSNLVATVTINDTFNLFSTIGIVEYISSKTIDDISGLGTVYVKMKEKGCAQRVKDMDGHPFDGGIIRISLLKHLPTEIKT